MRYNFGIVLFLFFISPQTISAQLSFANSANSPLITKLINGLNGVMYSIPGSDKTEVTLWFKSGSIYENDSVAGINNLIKNIISDRIRQHLNRGVNKLTAANTTFISFSEPEHTVFRFVTDENNMGEVFRLLRDSVFGATFNQIEIDTALARVEEQIKANDTIVSELYRKRILKEVFQNDYQKLLPLGNPAKFKYIQLYSVTRYFQKYYVAGNAIVSATGKLSASTFDSNFNAAFFSLPPSEFDPETITKIIDFHPMIYSNQFVINDTVENPEFRICWQFPGTYSYQQGSYFAFLLTAMLNDGNNYLQVLAKRKGCKKLEAIYEPGNFSGIFTVSIQPDKTRLIPTYDWIMNEMNRLGNTLMNESMVNAGKLIFKKQYEALKQTSSYVDNLIRFWPYKEATYFLELPDSVLDITPKEMRRFAGEYLSENAHVTGLIINPTDRNTLQIDSAFTVVTDSVRNYVFSYRPNITDLEGKENFAKFYKLAQWLKANPDVNVLVNGFADKSEYNKAFSDTIMKFIDSIPTFRKTMPDLIKKGYLRPETMRSLKILKMLNDYGIPLHRLAGTSMVVNAGNTKNELENMKCTLVLTKMRKVISAKEYHYGTNSQ